MNPKRFTVVDTRSNTTMTIESTANTVGELKADLCKNGINPDGMAIQEGLTKTELPSEDGAYLPHDVPYKGDTTNNLVFRLTQREKRIKSGSMSRKEAFDKVKELGLQDAIQSKYGRNFTQVSTDNLIAEIEKCYDSTDTPAPEVEGTDVKDAVALLTSKLVEYDFLTEEDGEEIVGLLGVELESPSDYSAKEIEDMFKDMDD